MDLQKLLYTAIARISGLEHKVDEVNKKLDQLLDQTATKNVNIVMDTPKIVDIHLNQRLRDALKPVTPNRIQQAIDDVNDLIKKPQLPYRYWSQTKYHYVPSPTNPIELVVNKEKGTVVALMKKDKKVIRVGKAKCHPDDVFHKEIGAVIAVRRLFELEIPEVYTKTIDKKYDGWY